jgi:hypothetical protein
VVKRALEFLEMNNDITQQKRSEKELRENKPVQDSSTSIRIAVALPSHAVVMQSHCCRTTMHNEGPAPLTTLTRAPGTIMPSKASG